MVTNYFSRIQLSIFSLVIVVMAFSSCAKYKPTPLGMGNVQGQTVDSITVGARALSETDCYAAFSRRILKKGYQPIQLLIVNDSDQSYILHAHNIGLELESTKVIASKLHLNTTGRVISWGAPAFFGLPIFLLPAIVEGVWSNEANKKLDLDFMQRTISHDTTLYIAPHSWVNRVLFVATEKMPSHFETTLINKQNNKALTFELKPF
ncbi:MAG: hypothetical protein WCT20_02960 [Candidatus Babeliales bacterium]|jgi:hypothetical protein